MSYASEAELLHLVGLSPAIKQAVASFLLLAGRLRSDASGRRAWDSILPFHLREPWAGGAAGSCTGLPDTPLKRSGLPIIPQDAVRVVAADEEIGGARRRDCQGGPGDECSEGAENGVGSHGSSLSM